MDKQQLVDVYDHVTANWNLQPTANRNKTLDTWHRYLQDCDYQKTIEAIDRHAYAGDYPPRPAELRIEVLAGPDMPPIPAQALVEAQQLTTAIKNGTRIPQVHELVARTVENYGLQRDDVFMRIYEERRRGYLAKLYSY